MHPAGRNILSLLAGVVGGSAVNMFLITISSSVIPPPEGVDVTNMESLAASMHLFEPKHFIFPFLAHALGTFAGAMLTVLIAASHANKLALAIGLFFLLGGVVNAFLLPAPTWFIIVDLVGAYLPMVWLAEKLVKK